MRTIRPAAGAAFAVLTLAALALAGCGSPGSGKTQLEFFQYKGEARQDFDALVAKFEEENPDIDVVVNNPPDADTAIRTLLVKGRTPDVITLNGSGNFGLLAKAGVFHDFTNEAILDQINPATVQILTELGTYQDQINSLPYLSNANGIIYNKDIFAAQGIEVPQTWDQLIAACQALQDAGITPFFGTVQDAWTVLPSFNGLGAYAAKDGFFDQLRAQGSNVGPDSPVSFQKNIAPVFAQQGELYSYAQEGFKNATYDDGNAAFAKGQAAMLLQGVWAVSMIRELNPAINVGIFPYPAATADDTLLVTGVDIAVTIGKDTKRLAQARRFVEFLFHPDNIEQIAQSQSMFSSRMDAPKPADPMLSELQPYFDDGKVAGFVDHQVPASVPLQQLDPEFLMGGDPVAELRTLDSEWRKYAKRTANGEES
jgi:raffinose/stachyose/melibiose transport system substrate-binding protein